MSSRVCYIEREDRGAVLRCLRVLGAQTDDTWQAPTGDTGLDPTGRSFASAASWVGDRLNGRLGGRVLDRLCLDVDGAVCSWVTSNSTETRLVRAVIEQENTQDSDDPFAVGQAGAGRFPDLPGEVGYQALGTNRPKGEGAVRIPVLAVPDVAARALIDALDESGVQIGSCVTLWQAMLKAWSAGSSSSSERIVVETHPVVAVVLCVPGDRVVWAWGRSGTPIATGAFRTRLGTGPSNRMMLDAGESAEPGNHPVAASFGGRLSAEWLAWSAQIGQAPSRIVWVGPVETEPGLGGAEIASALRRAAPGASVDVIDEADPIGLTLRRLAERLDSGKAGGPAVDEQLVGLSNRPGRVHRAMYRWLAILLLAASGAMVALAWNFWDQRSASQEQLALVRSNQRELLEAGAPDLVNDRLALLHLRERIDRARGPATVDVPPPKPVIRELETLAFVLGNPDYELQEIDISSLSVTFRVRVDDTLAFEQLQKSLLGIAGSSVAWTPLIPRQQGGRIDVSANGTWMIEGQSSGGDS